MIFSPYSYSILALYDQCARKFKYQKIDKAKTGNPDRTALLKGGAVHNMLENYPKEGTHKWAPKYKHIVEKFINSELGQRYVPVKGLNEVKFGLTKDLEPCDYNNKAALFRGKIDKVTSIETLLHLCDWKTGKYQEQKWQDYRQLLFYAIYFFKRYPTINQIKITYIYVEHELENELLLDRKYLDVYIKELLSLINRLENDSTWDKCVSKLCEYCDYKEHCEKDT